MIEYGPDFLGVDVARHRQFPRGAASEVNAEVQPVYDERNEPRHDRDGRDQIPDVALAYEVNHVSAVSPISAPLVGDAGSRVTSMFDTKPPLVGNWSNVQNNAQERAGDDNGGEHRDDDTDE